MKNEKLKALLCSHKLSIVVFVVFITGNSFARQPVVMVPVNNKFIRYEGRIGFDDPAAAKIYWAGSSVTIRFTGKELKAVLKDERGHNYYNIIIDNDSIRVINTDTVKRIYSLASNLSNGEHTVQLFKRTDAKAGMTWFYGFQTDEHFKILAIPPKKRTIEFYGNSVTVGSGISEGAFPGGDENNYLSYAAVTARHFNARYSCIARSGIGLMVSWFNLIMTEMFTRLNPDDSTSRWDFRKLVPGIVVIDLLQNDNALVGMPEHEQFKKRFGNNAPSEETIVNTYKHFVKAIRERYPAAHIVCTLGSMDVVRPGSPWPGYVSRAVSSLNDKKIHTHFFKYKNSEDHPDIREQQQMADSLIDFIDKNIQW